jgi:hypothetical protein
MKFQVFRWHNRQQYDVLTAICGDRNDIVNACKFSAKTREPAGSMSCGRARELDGVRRSAKYQAISVSIKTAKNSEK